MQLSYMREHAESLLEFLDVLLERTYAESPKRKQSYMLNRQRRTGNEAIRYSSLQRDRR